jgi:hypothetical protein
MTTRTEKMARDDETIESLIRRWKTADALSLRMKLAARDAAGCRQMADDMEADFGFEARDDVRDLRTEARGHDDAFKLLRRAKRRVLAEAAR